MNADDRLRRAYNDLSSRANRAAHQLPQEPSMTAPNNSKGITNSNGQGLLGGSPRFGGLGRPGLALAAAIVVVGGGAAAIGLTGGNGDNQQIDTASQPSTETSASTGDATTASTAATGDTTDGETGQDREPDLDTVTGRLRVAFDAVAADTADPFLNVRLEPDPEGPVMAKLPASYTGLRATGETATASDGGSWIQVELLHPVAVNAIDPERARPLPGWVNAAFVEELPDGVGVTTDEVPACAGGFDPVETGAGLDQAYVYGIESGLVAEDCQRIVVTFGAGQVPFEWRSVPDGTGPATALPEVFTASSGGFGTAVDLGSTDSAWQGATGTSDGVYVARSADGSVDLVLPRPDAGITLTGLAERGVLVIDVELDDRPAPPSEHGVVLTQPALIGAGSVEVVGLARPFEATLGVTLEDGSGDPVEAVFSGSSFLGTVQTDEYGVTTNDWTEAWGNFALRVEGLAAGDYILVLNPDGASDDPQTFRLPVTIEESGPEPDLATPAELQAVLALAALAQGGPDGSPSLVDEVPLADEVILALGPATTQTLSAAELSDRSLWTFSDTYTFAGFSGPFSALDRLAQPGLRITTGPVPHCAGPPREWLPLFDGLTQVNLEPIGIDSCISWFGVHVFVDDDGNIAAVALDLFGP